MQRTKLSTMIRVAASGLALHAGIAMAASGPGSVDTTFGKNGVVTLSVPNASAGPTAAFEQSNGDIVVVGGVVPTNSSGDLSNEEIFVARFTSSGVLDKTFGTNGMTTTAIGNNTAAPVGAAVLSNGDILVAANAGSLSSNGGNLFTLVAYTSNGALDTTFGNGGIVTTAVGDQNDERVGPILLQPNGQIVFGGTQVGDAKNQPAQTVLIRYNSNGSLDTTFGSGGIVLTATAAVPGPNAIALLSNGDYLVLGSNAQVEFSSTGALLSSTTTASVTAMSDTNPLFESSGDYILASTVSPATSTAEAIKIARGLRPEHTPVNPASNAEIARFAETGSADATFTSTAFSFVSSPTTSDNESSVTQLAIASNGQIIGAGRLAGSASSSISIGLARLNANGGLDTTFGNGGVVTSAAAEGASGLLIQNDGNIVVLGESSAAAIVLVRFLAN